MNYKGKGL